MGGNDGVASLSSVERFDPHLNKWTEVREMGQRRAGNGVGELNGCLYVVGKNTAQHPCNYILVIVGGDGDYGSVSECTLVTQYLAPAGPISFSFFFMTLE